MMKNDLIRDMEPTLFFEDLIAQPEKPIKFRLLSTIKALRDEEHALVCLIPEELEEKALNRTLVGYYTGYRFPSTINLLKTRYFIPYIKGRGIRDIYQIHTIHAGTKHDLIPSSKDRYMRLFFDFTFDRQLFDEYMPTVLKVWYTYTDASIAEIKALNFSNVNDVAVSTKTDNSRIEALDKSRGLNNDTYHHIENRRYIGCKNKLLDWIFSVINSNVRNAKTFCDIFAGTGVVSNRAINDTHITDGVNSENTFREVIMNDFLFSNEIIYKAFFADSPWSITKIEHLIREFNDINPSTLPNNYFSINYGNKFFELSTAKKIGEIRQRIEDIKNNLTEKEYCILLTSLIYSMDKVANTLGHYDAYIKKEIKRIDFSLKMIDARRYKNVSIYREDANKLARHIKADIVYLDPPYNSRQYSRFYHVYENLIHWDGSELFGSAMKPKEENMSDYCRSNAVTAFTDLVAHLNTKYIVVSYNNTYNSKSSSSENKITLEQIVDALGKCGTTMIFAHNYKAFDSGKTEMDNHQEYLFITEVDNEKRSRSFTSILCGR